MQSSNAPNKISLPFAASGTKNTIPVPSQQSVTPGAASFTDGFPPLTFTPLSAGGVPPSGADFNGILNAITTLQQWKSAGGQFLYDATFATAIGGYPKGATVLKADGTGLWISTAENNTANPDTGGAGWLAFSASSVQVNAYNVAYDIGAVNAYAMILSPPLTVLSVGMVVTITNVANTNTGASTLNVSGFGALPVLQPGGAPLAPGMLAQGAFATFVLNQGANSWTLVHQSGSGLLLGGAAANFASVPNVASVPIINTGVNSNGSYIQFYNGTMVSAAYNVFPNVNAGQSGIQQTYNFPAAFTNLPAVVACVSNGTYIETVNVSTTRTSTTYTVWAFNGGTNDATGLNVSIYAYGNWK